MLSAASGLFSYSSEEPDSKYHKQAELLRVMLGASEETIMLRNRGKENGCLSSHMVHKVVRHDIGEFKYLKLASA